MLCQPASRAVARFLLCVLAIPTALAGVNTWTVKGPPGGQFTDIEVSATDSDVLYATYARTFFRSTDGGATWQVMREFVSEAEDISVDPTDGNRVYVAVIEDGVFRSDNGGQSFTQIVPGSAALTWSVGAADDGQTVYYADGAGRFFRSSNRGQNWTERTQTQPTVTRIQIEPGQPDSIMALRGPFLMRSANGGGSWTEQDVDGDTINSIVRLSPTVLVAATGDGLTRSVNDGDDWTEIFDGAYTALALDPVTPGTMYAAASGPDQPLLVGTVLGTSWVTFGTAPLGITKRIVVTPGRFIVANAQGVQRSVNAGTTWAEATSGPNASAPTDLATTVAANSKVYAHSAGDGDGLFVMSDDSAWQRIDIRDAYQQLGAVSAQTGVGVKPGSPDSVFLGVFSAGIARSTNGGTSWTASATPLGDYGFTSFGFDPDDANTIYTSAVFAGALPPAAVYRSVDNGDTWQPHSLDLPNVYGLRVLVDPSDSDRMFLAAFQNLSPMGTGGLWRSVNAGLNWTQTAFAGQDVLDVEIDPSDPDVVYAATQTGFHTSTNGGTSFTANAAFDAITTLAARAIAIDPVVPTTLYVASIDPVASLSQTGSVILRSVDSGQSWETLRAQSADPRWYVSDLALDPNTPTRVYAATGGRGVGAFEVVNDLRATITGHSGILPRGQAASFTVQVTNDGPYAGTALSTEIDLPAGLTNVSWTPSAGSCSRAGDTVTCIANVLRTSQSVSVLIGFTPPGDMALPITATVSAHERDGATTNNTAQATASAAEVVDLSVTLTPAPATVDRGASLTLTAQVSNAGPNDATAATLTLTPDANLTVGTLPAGCAAAGANVNCAVGALASGASRSFAIPVTTAASGTLASSASVAEAAGAHDPDTANNSASANVISRAISDLSVAITDNTDPVNTGTSYQYSIVVQNLGPDSASGVVATLTAPGTVSATTSTQGSCASGTCTIGTLASGSSATLTVTTSSATAGTATMQATVTFPGTDNAAANNSASQSTTVNAPPGGGGGGGNSGGGGGGALDLGWLLLGMLLVAYRNGIAKRRPAVF